MLLRNVQHRIVAAAWSRPFLIKPFLRGTAEGLLGVAVGAALLKYGFHATDKFILVPSSSSSSSQLHQHQTQQNQQQQNQQQQNPTEKEAELNTIQNFSSDIPTFFHTLYRVMIVPSLVEECFWRVALIPSNAIFSSSKNPSFLIQILCSNAAFALYHMGTAQLLRIIRPGAPRVFTDPAFLSLAFVLGNACTWAYLRSGGILWAPVIVHALPVTIWLVFLGGEHVLSSADFPQ